MEGCAAADKSEQVVVISSPFLQQTWQSNVLELMTAQLKITDKSDVPSSSKSSNVPAQGGEVRHIFCMSID